MKVILNYLSDSTTVPMSNHLKIALIGGTKEVTRLEELLKPTKIPHRFVGRLTTVSALEAFFSTPPFYDLILVDSSWENGKALPLLNTLGVTARIIVCAKSEKHALAAIKHNCIDYLVTPIETKHLKQALEKYISIAQTWKDQLLVLAGQSLHPLGLSDYKKRFLVRTERNFQLIGNNDILCFYSENGRSFLVEQSGKEFAIDFTLERLEDLLDPERFFRINRKVTVNIDHIHSIEEFPNNRLKIQLNKKAPMELIVSRKRVKDFKSWLRGMV